MDESNRTEAPAKRLKKSEDDQLDWNFPTSIECFGFAFSAEGKLLDVKTNKPFEFEVSSNNLFNQKRYEALGELINEYVYGLLETEGKLKKIFIPIDAEVDEPRGFVFASEDALSNPDKLLVLIHGSGVVRAGQWARRLIINDCLDSGTQLPFIKKGLSEGYGIIILNTNLNSVNDVPIRGSETAENHTNYVWEKLIQPAKAVHIAIVAHSFGGVCTIDLFLKQRCEMQKRVFAIALTDSVHNLVKQGIPHTPDLKWLREVSCNWVSSSKPLDDYVASYGRIDIYKMSAGTTLHERTSWSSFESIFKFLHVKYQKVIDTRKDDEDL